MTNQEKNQLLEEILDDDELNRLRESCLSRGLKEMRGRRRRGLAMRVSMVALPVMILAAVVFYPRLQPMDQKPAWTATAFSTKTDSKVEYINAEQLFALFPNRSMALVGKVGHQQVIFLDDRPAGDSR